MPIITKIETERLILRSWKDEDAAVFAAINQDPHVIEFLRGAMTLQERQEFITRTTQFIAKNGLGL